MKDYFSDLPQKHDTSRADGLQQLEPSPQLSMLIPVPPQAAALGGVLDITKQAIRCFTEYAKCKEHEKTERERIAATLRSIEYQIDAQKEVYLKEMDKQYEERNKLYDSAEKAHEIALNSGDKEMLKIYYNFILNIYNKPIESNGKSPALFGDIPKTLDSN